MNSQALEAGTMVGEYRIDRLLAEGGMGAVYIATHPMIGKRAAVKVMSSALCTVPSAVDRFIQEARVVNQIGHRNIVDVFSFGELEDGRAFLVMEYVEGDCLADVLAKGALPIADVLAILDQVADAVQAAHASGVVHRDLKPDNIMLVDAVNERRQVKLLDFGIAKLASPEDGGRSVTGTGLVVGTPNYMSPEQARGKGVDHRTDIYALGCVAFEMITGEVPYPADNAADSVIQHCQAPVPSAGALRAETPQALDQLVRGMLSKDVDERPTVLEIRAALREIAPRLEQRSVYASTTFERAASQAPPVPLRTATPLPVERDLGRQPTEVAVAEALAEVRGRKGRLGLVALVGLLAVAAIGLLFASGLGPSSAVPATATPTDPAAHVPAQVEQAQGRSAVVPVVEPAAAKPDEPSAQEEAAAAANGTDDTVESGEDGPVAAAGGDDAAEGTEPKPTKQPTKVRRSSRQRAARGDSTRASEPSRAGAGDVDYTIDPF